MTTQTWMQTTEVEDIKPSWQGVEERSYCMQWHFRKGKPKSFLGSSSSTADLGWKKIDSVQLLRKTTVLFAECLSQSEWGFFWDFMQNILENPRTRHKNRHPSSMLKTTMLSAKRKLCFVFEEHSWTLAGNGSCIRSVSSGAKNMSKISPKKLSVCICWLQNC